MAEKKLSKVLIMAGGTGGHVFPGLSLAQVLREKNIEVHWLGTPQGMEARLVAETNIPFHSIAIGGVRNKGLKTLLAAPFHIGRAILQSRRVLKQIQPDVVIGMGGFVSGPGGVASWLMRCPLVIHEQNAKAGITNQWLARFSVKVLEGFPASFPKNIKTVTVGNPVRQDIEQLPAPLQRAVDRKPWQILVLGGSLGAKALNEMLPKALSLLEPSLRPKVLHQTGEKGYEETSTLYEQCHLEPELIRLQPFLKNMAKAYEEADLVICRAGALTVAEVCAAGLPAILVPFPHAVDDHQTKNAHFLVKNQAAICVQQADLTPEKLAALLKQFAEQPIQRKKMAQAAYELRKPRVAETIVAMLEESLRP